MVGLSGLKRQLVGLENSTFRSLFHLTSVVTGESSFKTAGAGNINLYFAALYVLTIAQQSTTSAVRFTSLSTSSPLLASHHQLSPLSTPPDSPNFTSIMSSQNPSPGINLTKVFAIASAAAAFLQAGTFLSSSNITIPTILHSPTSSTTTNIPHLVSQWRRMYDIGLPTAMTLFGISATSTLLALYGLQYKPVTWGMLPSGTTTVGVLNSAATQAATRRLLAGLCITAGFLPYTLLVLLPTNNELMAMDDAASKGREVLGSRAVELVRWWGVGNYVRAVFPFVGGLIGLLAL